jgi:hypothetical protein
MIENSESIHAYIWPETTVMVVFGHRVRRFCGCSAMREIRGFATTAAIHPGLQVSDAHALDEQSGAPLIWRDGVRHQAILIGWATAKERQFKVCQTFN